MRDMTKRAATTEAQPVWCIVANVVDQRPYGPGGAEWRCGLRLFSAGAKVYVPDGYAGMGYQTVTVIGRTRHAPRYAIVDVATEHLTNWRLKLVYSPAVLDRIAEVCWHPHRGFSAHGDDRSSETYRNHLQRMADRFQQDTDEAHRHWRGEPPTGRTGRDRAAAAGLVARCVARLRRLLSMMRSAGRSV